jgi:hypothetical protein
VVVVLFVVFVSHCVGWNRHPGHDSQTKNCDHELAKLHIFPLKLVAGQFPADQPVSDITP